MLGIEKIPVGIQEFLKNNEEQRKAFLSIFRHITKKELQWDETLAEVVLANEREEAQAAEIKETYRVKKDAYDANVECVLAQEDELLSDNFDAVFFDGLKTLQKDSLAQNERLREINRARLASLMEQRDLNATQLFSPRKTQRKTTKYESGLVGELRNLAKLLKVDETSDAMEEDEEESVDVASQQMRQKYPPAKLAHAWCQLLENDLEGSEQLGDQSALSVDGKLSKALTNATEAASSNGQQISDDSRIIQDKINSVLTDNNRLTMELSKEIRAIGERCGDMGAAADLEEFISQTRQSDCFQSMAECGEKSAPGRTAHSRTAGKIRKLRCELNNNRAVGRGLQHDHGALVDKVNEAVELINTTTQRCETLNAGIAEIELAEAEAKAKLLDLINKSEDNPDASQTLSGAKEAMGVASFNTFESAVDLLFGQDNRPERINLDESVVRRLEDEIGQQNELVGLLMESAEIEIDALATHASATDAYIDQSRRDIKREDFQKLLENVFLLQNSEFKAAYAKYAAHANTLHQ